MSAARFLLLGCFASFLLADSNSSDCLSHLLGIFPRAIRKAAVFGEDVTLLDGILKKLKVPLVVNAVEAPTKMDTCRSDLVVVLGDWGVSAALKSTSWDRDTMFFALRDPGNNPEVDLRQLWEQRALNGYVSDGRSVHTYEPYLPGRCGLPTVIPLGECDGVRLSRSAAGKVSNGNKCFMDASVVDNKPQIIFPVGVNTADHISGIEALLFETFAEKLNFTARFSLPADGLAWGSVHPPTGIAGDLLRRKTDFGFGLISPTMSRYENLDLSKPYDGSECVTFLVPAGAGPGGQHWLQVFVVHFSPIEWILIGAAFISVTTLLCFHFHPTDAFTSVFSSFLGNPIRIPETLKYLILTWIIYSYVLSTVFKAFLGSNITVSPTSPEINTIGELLDSNLRLAGHAVFYGHLLDDENNTRLLETSRRYVKMTLDAEAAVAEMLTDRRMTYMTDLMPCQFAVSANPSAIGKFHTLKECVKTYTPVAALQRNSPFTPLFDDVVSKLFESGITGRWKSQFVRDIIPDQAPYRPLDLQQSAALFGVFFIGLAFAFVAFIAEIAIFFSPELPFLINRCQRVSAPSLCH